MVVKAKTSKKTEIEIFPRTRTVKQSNTHLRVAEALLVRPMESKGNLIW